MSESDEELKPDDWRLIPGDTLSGHRVIVDERGREVFLIYAMEPGDDEATRRGRLASAAPDLLAALKAMMDVQDSHGDCWCVEVGNPGSCEACRCRAAIAKAEGM